MFGLEEYQNDKGELKTMSKMTQFRSIDKVDNAKIPRVKLLDGTYIEYEQYKKPDDLGQKAIDVFGSDIVEINPDELPF